MNITPSTRIYAVLGHPIRHSLSPLMHNAALAALGMDAVYLAFDVHPDRLLQVLPVMAELGFAGVNLTVPLKEVAFRGLSELDESARLLGSVNTVKFAPRRLQGYSTDGEGFRRGVREAFRISVKGLSVFMLGCGGAGRAVAIACAREGAGRLVLTDLDLPRARKLETEITAGGWSTRVATVDPDRAAWTRACRECDLVVQATPVGMHPGDAPLLGPEAFRRGQKLYDLIYMFPETPLMRAARQGGAKVSNGLGMLLHQGACSLAIWTGRAAPVAVMRRTLESAIYGKRKSRTGKRGVPAEDGKTNCSWRIA